MGNETQKALIVALMLAAVFYLAKQKPSEAPVGNDYPNAMVVVPPVGMGASIDLDEWAEVNSIELRRYAEGVNLEEAEPWVKELYQATEGNRPAAAVRRNGEIVVVPVDDNLLENLRGLK